MRKKMVILCLLTCTFITANAKTAQWVSTGKSQEYPAEFYFLGIGMSNKSMDAAKEQAIADVAKQISVNIKATTIDVQSEESFGSKSLTSYEKAESHTRLSTEGRLEGVSVVETARSRESFHALAVLDKKKFSSVQKARIAELRKTIIKTLDAAKQAIQNGRIVLALQSLREIRIASNEIIERRRLLSAASGLTQMESVPVTQQDLNAVMEKCVTNLRLEKISGDNQVFTVGQTLTEPFVLSLAAGDGGLKAPVPGVSLYVIDEDGQKILETISMSDGRIEIFPAEEAAGMGIGKHEFSVMIRLRVSSALKKQLKAMSQKFSFEVLSNPSFTNLKLNLPNNVKAVEKKAEKKIWKMLNRADIRKDENAPATLEMTFEVNEKGRVQGLSAGNTFIEVITSADCVLKENDKEVLAFNLKSAKGMGSTLEKSFLKSLANVKLKKNLPALAEKLRGATLAPKVKLAVFPFKNTSLGAQWYELSQSLTGMVITGMINSNRFEVVEREMLDKIMQEKELGMTGATDMSQDIQVAQLAGAQYLVVGSVSRQAGNIEADARLVSVERARAVAAANGRIASRTGLRELANQLVDRLKKTRLD